MRTSTNQEFELGDTVRLMGEVGEDLIWLVEYVEPSQGGAQVVHLVSNEVGGPLIRDRISSKLLVLDQ